MELTRLKWWPGPYFLPEYHQYKPLNVSVPLIRMKITRPKHPIWYKEYSEWNRIVGVRTMFTRAIDAICGRKFTSENLTQVDKYWMEDRDRKSSKFGKTTIRKFVSLTNCSEEN
jgi:hypothetical protein